MTEQKKRAIPELSLDTQTLERVLRAVDVDDIVTYMALSRAIEGDVTTSRRGNLRSARARLEREHIVFGAVAGVGLKRLNDVGKVASQHQHLRRSRNQARFSQRKARAVDNFDALPNETKLAHNMGLAVAGVLLNATSARTAKRLSAVITEPQAKFSAKDSLRLMTPLL